VPVENLDVTGVAQLLADLNIAEHKDQFRRTTGQLLVQLSKTDLRDRFSGDKEAADILWAFLEKHRASAISNGDGSDAAALPVKATPSRATTGQRSVEAQQIEQLFATFRSPDPFASLKRAMNPGRPARPSDDPQAEYELTEAEAAELEEKYVRATYKAQSENPAGKPTVLVEKIAHGTSLPRGQAAAARPPVAESTPPPVRGNRWQVVEYDDDDDDDDS
jgi:hypothetical protein